MEKEYKLKDRMAEFSTWEGLTALAGLIGYTVTAGDVNTLGAAAVAIYSVIKMFKKEKK